jgi:site-specific recombinase XerD
MSDLAHLDDAVILELRDKLVQAHVHIGQLDREERSTTARNYDSAIKALGVYLDKAEEPLPTKRVLERWRDDMLAEGKAIRTVNARLSAARKLLLAVSDEIFDLQIKTALRDWAGVKDAKLTIVQDPTERDYGVRLTLNQLDALINGIDLTSKTGLRDRAMIALMAGAGLRVSEVVAVTVSDVFLTQNSTGQRAIKIRKGKHHKSRAIVLAGWSNWVLECVEAYMNNLGWTPMTHAESILFPYSDRTAQRAIEQYGYNAHDLRRTYAKLCQVSGMPWDALRENLGHSSVMVTEKYVGHEVDWSDRMPNWSLKIRK